jgi:trimethylamine--corrinoid protein Co-methyltransferase
MDKLNSLSEGIKVLSKDDIDTVQEATLRVLEKVGVIFEDEEVQKLFKREGAIVNGNIVKIPPEIVKKAIEQCPSNVVLKARNPKRSVELGKCKVHYTNGFGATFVLDLNNGKCRKAQLKDLENFTKISDYLENVHYCLKEVIPQDIPLHLLDLYAASVLLKNTDKHVHISIDTVENVDKITDAIIRMADIAASNNEDSEKPIFSLGCCPITPLKYTKDATVKLVKATKRNIPFLIVSGAMVGSTAPVTLAGTLVVQNAEVLAGIVLTQLINPGTPVVYGSFSSPTEMHGGKQMLGCPEAALLNAATAQLCKSYKIPFGYGTGGVADSPVLDVQAGFEKMLTVLFSSLAGVEVVHDGVSGLLGTAMIASYEQIIIDNEICNMVNRSLSGIVVNEETLALDLIEEVGPGGEYITADHTLQNFRKEFYLSKLANKISAGEWLEHGGKGIIENAREKVKEILKTHRPNKLDKNTEVAMDKVLKSFG